MARLYLPFNGVHSASQLDAGVVTTPAIADGAVTFVKMTLANGDISGVKITDATVTRAKLTLVGGDIAGSLLSGASVTSDKMSLTQPTILQLLIGSGLTYTTPANCVRLLIRMIGGGGGGGGSETANGTAGNDTIFNGIHAAGGSAGLGAGSPGAGGVAGTGTADIRVPGKSAGRRTSHFLNSNGQAGPTNTGQGGEAGNYNSGARAGGSGGDGEEVWFHINNPAASYTYTVGAAAAGGSATQNGGAGGSGRIDVFEFYA